MPCVFIFDFRALFHIPSIINAVLFPCTVRFILRVKNGLPKFGLYWEKHRFLWAWFSQICCCGRPPNVSCKAKFVLLLLRDEWRYIFLLINWLETIQFCNTNHVVLIFIVTSLWSLYLNENRDHRWDDLRMTLGMENWGFRIGDSRMMMDYSW